MSGGQQPAPTPNEIARECEAIQKEWTEDVKEKRRVTHPMAVVIREMTYQGPPAR